MSEQQDKSSAAEGRSDLEGVVMCRCGVNPATEPHSCPYAEDINGNDDSDFCTCCADCQHECAMDI